MRISMPDLLFALSYALDAVEGELLGATPYHSRRVAYLSVQVGRSLGLDGVQLVDLACAAALHDNALTEYITSEYQAGNDILASRGLSGKAAIDLKPHCTFGERNVSEMPFYSRIEDVILYHHENADGTGPFKVPAEQTPLYAQIIHLTDILDVTCDLSSMTPKKYERITQMLSQQRGRFFTPKVVDAFTARMDYLSLSTLRNDRISDLLRTSIPDVMREYTGKELTGLAVIFARITDYKSRFTSSHSMGIAEKARDMAHYYRLGDRIESEYYLAGALHDIGKLVIDRDVLEKPAKLTSEEYVYIQNHAWYSWQILSQVRGFEDLSRWASFHHEKLDGSGYPFGKHGYELNGLERLMACIDIYQALTEERPYKPGLTHARTLEIMRGMVDQGKIDGRIVEDIDDRFGAARTLVGSRDLI
jgi:HD-GYP domain-containing protein (c-di-GMP phosphodiesterase class II)